MYARMFPIESGPTQDLRSTLTAQQKGIDNMNWQLEQKTKQVRMGLEYAQEGLYTQSRDHDSTMAYI